MAILTTVIICATILVGIRIIQHHGLPTIRIKYEVVQPPIPDPTPLPYDGEDQDDPLNPELEDPERKKKQTPRDMAALINAFLEGEIDIE